MNRSPRVATIVATVAMVASACGGSAAVAPSQPVPPTQAASAASATPAAFPSPAPSPSHRVARMTVAGTEVKGSSPVNATADLPPSWSGDQNAADIHPYGPPAGIGFNLSVIDDTFADPCKHQARDPKIGSTVAARAAALGEIPGVSTKAPVQTTIAGREATYIELTIPRRCPVRQTSSPCGRTRRATTGTQWGRTSLARMDPRRRRPGRRHHRPIVPGHHRRIQRRAATDPRLDRIRSLTRAASEGPCSSSP